MRYRERMQLLPVTTKSRVSAEQCAATVLLQLPEVMWFIRRHMRRSRVKGLSVPQFRTMALLDRCPRATLSAVSEHLGSSSPTASRIIDGLVCKGFVARANSSADRRQISLELTRRGRAALSVAQANTRSALAERLAALSPRDRALVAGTMTSLGELFGRSASTETADGNEGKSDSVDRA
jgi:DNA-binding MarR family transcriptional regulator